MKKKNNIGCDPRFAKKLFIKHYNEGYTIVYIMQQMSEWLHINLNDNLINEWLLSDKILSKSERQNKAICHVMADDFRHMERININYLSYKYEIPIWRIQILIDLYMMDTTAEEVPNEI